MNKKLAIAAGGTALSALFLIAGQVSASNENPGSAETKDSYVEVARYSVAGMTITEAIDTANSAAYTWAQQAGKSAKTGYAYRTTNITTGQPRVISQTATTVRFSPALDQGRICTLEKDELGLGSINCAEANPAKPVISARFR